MPQQNNESDQKMLRFIANDILSRTSYEEVKQWTIQKDEQRTYPEPKRIFTGVHGPESYDVNYGYGKECQKYSEIEV